MKRLKWFAAALTLTVGAALGMVPPERGDTLEQCKEFPGAKLEVPKIPDSENIQTFARLYKWKGTEGKRVFQPITYTLDVGKNDNWSGIIGSRLEYRAGGAWKNASQASWQLHRVWNDTFRRHDLKLQVLPAAFGDALPSRMRLMLATEHGLYPPSYEVVIGESKEIARPKALAILPELRANQPYDERLLNLRVFARAENAHVPGLWRRWDVPPSPNTGKRKETTRFAVPGYAPWPIWLGVKKVWNADTKEWIEEPKWWYASPNSGKTVPRTDEILWSENPPRPAALAGILKVEVPFGVGAAVRFNGKVLLTTRDGVIRLPQLYREVIGTADPLKARELVTQFEEESTIEAVVPKELSRHYKAGPAVKLGREYLRVTDTKTVNTLALKCERLGYVLRYEKDVRLKSVRLYQPEEDRWSVPLNVYLQIHDGYAHLLGPQPELTGWLLEVCPDDRAPLLCRIGDPQDLRLQFKKKGQPRSAVILNDYREPVFAAPGLSDAVRAAQESILEKLDERLGGSQGNHRFLALAKKGDWPASARRKPFLACQGPVLAGEERQRLPRGSFWERVRDAALEPELRTGGPLSIIVVTVFEGDLAKGFDALKSRIADEESSLTVVPVIVGPSGYRRERLKKSIPGMIYVPVSLDDKQIESRIDEAVQSALKAAALVPVKGEQSR
ncbi:MAG TPA: hypothetical protein VMG10_11635 [Gemmataceae bacterium]|nr:hypothetical protein [Gemmataceae bacterium]